VAASAPVREVLRDELTASYVELFGIDRLVLLEVSQDGSAGSAEVMRPGGHTEPGYFQVLDRGRSGTGHVVTTDSPLFVAEAPGSTELNADLVVRFDVASALFVPVSWGGEVRYVLVGIFETRREIEDDEIAVARALADQAAAGFARFEAEQRAQARARQDQALVRAARALNASLDLDEVLHTLAREA
jgi:GAF domain-containing protein